MSDQTPELLLPPRLQAAVSHLNAKDHDRFTEAATALHQTNTRLWAVEDRVRGTGLTPEAIADDKRHIDQLNIERAAFAERIDEAALAFTSDISKTAIVHTESLSSVLDRLSVLILRLHHTERSAARGGPGQERLPALRAQLRELGEALDSLVSDLRSGRRRVPNGARFKLYRAETVATASPRPSASLRRVVALGGMSECGKTSSGIYLRETQTAARFKIGYLLTQAAARHGIADPYALSARRQAELLLDELNRFADAHLDVELITIESVHGAASIAELKTLLGDRLCLLYLDVPFALRVRRSGMSVEAVAAKDHVKTARGGDRVTTIADTVLDNSGSMSALYSGLRRVARPALPQRYQIVAAERLAVPEPIRRATSALARDVPDGARLVALTGSATNGEWIAGWSDLDLLVVADREALSGVADAVRAYRELIFKEAPCHIGVTLVTPGEVVSRRLPQRLLFAFHLIQNGAPVLLADPVLRLPAIGRGEVERAAAEALAQVLITLRRLRLQPEEGLRPVYKHLVLAARLVLQEHGVWEEGSDHILDAVRNLPGLEALLVPTLAEVAAAHCGESPDPAVGDQVIAAADLLLEWYALQTAA